MDLRTVQAPRNNLHWFRAVAIVSHDRNIYPAIHEHSLPLMEHSRRQRHVKDTMQGHHQLGYACLSGRRSKGQRAKTKITFYRLLETFPIKQLALNLRGL